MLTLLSQPSIPQQARATTTRRTPAARSVVVRAEGGEAPKAVVKVRERRQRRESPALGEKAGASAGG